MIRIERFINELMSSNCFVVYDDKSNNCIIIDPGTENCKELIGFIDSTNLKPEFVFLTHEHTDHTWGCNTLIDRFDVKVVCSQTCKALLPKEGRTYFQFYYDNPNYEYTVKRVDIVLENIEFLLNWNGYLIQFIETPGHSDGSVCISIENNLFTGDMIMLYKPYIPRKKDSKEQYKQSLDLIFNSFDLKITKIFPGHGESFYLYEVESLMADFINS